VTKTIEMKRFEFVSGAQRGVCFVRVRIKDDGLVFLFAQLDGKYTGISVTNAVEDIFPAVVKRLENDNELPQAYAAGGLFNRRSAVEKVLHDAVVISYVPVGRMLGSPSSAPDGIFQVIDLRSKASDVGFGSPITKVVAAQHAGVEVAFMVIDPNDLVY
jgi:hypothetical protein